ncbi:hypothetical protein [Proteus columbae]|uniref:tail fiber/spike domain-containing protein n=1 Tax=Proteus columbae TaxID=1987580 RepID=UPI00288C114B|nr:hypothetical protein [Proteus columbae]
MTVSTELSHEEYVGNGVTTDFDFRFRIFESRHLIVVVADNDGNETTLKNGTDYFIVGVGSYFGGKVVLSKPLAEDWKILLERDLPVVQETDLRNQGKFFAEVHEDAFDYLTMLIQKALGTFSLSLRKPTYLSNYYDAKGNRIASLASPKVGTDAANKDYVDNSIKDIDSKTLRVKDKPIPALPSTEQRRNKQLGFDNEGNPKLLDPAETGALGYVLVDSFEKGSEITTRYQALHWENNGEYYRWDGDLPKSVPVNSTPENSGGIGIGKWVSVGDASLRPLVNKLSKRSGEIYVIDYLDTSASFSDALQLAIDNANADDGVGHGNKVILPAGRFKITKRVFIHEKDGLNIVGAGDGATVLVVDSLLSNVEPKNIMDLNGAYKGYQYDILSAQAIFVITARRITQNVGFERHNGAAWRLSIGGFSVESTGDAFKKVSTFYAPEIGLGCIHDISCKGVLSNLMCQIIYSFDYNNVNVQNSYIPIQHGLQGLESKREGTSLNLQRCNASKVEHGWSFGNLFYSSFNNVACDGWSDGYIGSEIKHFAYSFYNSQVVMNGCGCESVPGTAFGVINISGGSAVDMNNCMLLGGQMSAVSSYQSFISGNGTVLNLNNTLIAQGARTHLKIKVSEGAVVNISSVYRSNVDVAGFVKLSDFDTVDSISTVNLFGLYKSLLSLAKSVDTTLSVSGVRLSFDKIEYDTIKTISTPSTDRFTVPFSGDYRLEISANCRSSSEQELSIFINNDAKYSFPANGWYFFTKILQLKKGDEISIRAPSPLTSAITVKNSTTFSLFKI